MYLIFLEVSNLNLCVEEVWQGYHCHTDNWAPLCNFTQNFSTSEKTTSFCTASISNCLTHLWWNFLSNSHGTASLHKMVVNINTVTKCIFQTNFSAYLYQKIIKCCSMYIYIYLYMYTWSMTLLMLKSAKLHMPIYR